MSTTPADIFAREPLKVRLKIYAVVVANVLFLFGSFLLLLDQTYQANDYRLRQEAQAAAAQQPLPVQVEKVAFRP